MNTESILHDIDRALTDASDTEAALRAVVEILDRDVPHYTWTGFYMVDGEELQVGPYVGDPTPHTRIKIGEGICGAAAEAKETIIVDDVNADPRYLACSISTKSEIVVPLLDGDRCLGEIDIDSNKPAAFDQSDRELLEAVAE
ncbi:MAG TPA: GAF domain-containing protein, partial [candidate division Zixibacteria bacterium]|nr:GAF domain-containing protein [candidate division Zixibacteria bacterium]